MGAASLVAAPVMGARENGTKGFLQGLGVGIAGCAFRSQYSRILVLQTCTWADG